MGADRVKTLRILGLAEDYPQVVKQLSDAGTRAYGLPLYPCLPALPLAFRSARLSVVSETVDRLGGSVYPQKSQC